jgi:hypothetical protein
MTSPKPNLKELLELAKQGDTEAIAALMNIPLGAKGITADVTQQDDCLEIRLESDQIPDQPALVKFVHNGLANLSPEIVKKVKVYGYRRGEQTPDWQEEFELQPLVATTQKPNLVELVDLAKQGKAEAIAGLMNLPLQPRGITTYVAQRDDYLEVVLEGEQTPDEEALVKFVHDGLFNLGSELIKRVKLYGYRTGELTPDWEREFELHSLPDFLEPPAPVGMEPGAAMLPPDAWLEPPEDEEAPLLDAGMELPSDLVPEPLPQLGLELQPFQEQPYPRQPYPRQPFMGEIPLDAGAPPGMNEFPLEPALEEPEDESTTVQSPTPEQRQTSRVVGAGAIIALILLALGGIAYYFFGRSPQEQPSAITEAPPASPGTPASPEAPVSPIPPAPPTSPTPLPPEAGATPPPPSPAPPTVPAPSATPFRDAVNRATLAANLTQTATTRQNWQEVANLWEEAANLMGQVPPTDPNYATAQQRVGQYQQNRTYAQQRVQNARQ